MRSEYCIASSGAVSVNGPMLVAGVKEFSGTLPAQLDPGHMAGNGNVALVGPSTVVTGDVKAAGTVSQGGGVSVEGQVEQRHSAVVLPSIAVESYDPGASNPAARHLDPNYPGLTVDGLARREGDLVITVSGLELNNGLLFVRGNLVVHGGVSGTGAIICTGDVHFDGGGGAGDLQPGRGDRRRQRCRERHGAELELLARVDLHRGQLYGPGCHAGGWGPFTVTASSCSSPRFPPASNTTS